MRHVLSKNGQVGRWKYMGCRYRCGICEKWTMVLCGMRLRLPFALAINFAYALPS